MKIAGRRLTGVAAGIETEKESELVWIEEIERISVRKRTGGATTVAAAGLNFAGMERILAKEKEREMRVVNLEFVSDF